MTENTSNFYFFHRILFAIKLLKIFFAIFIHQKPQETNIIAIFLTPRHYTYIFYILIIFVFKPQHLSFFVQIMALFVIRSLFN